jgi:hypothetical protein
MLLVKRGCLPCLRRRVTVRRQDSDNLFLLEKAQGRDGAWPHGHAQPQPQSSSVFTPIGVQSENDSSLRNNKTLLMS